LYTTSIKIRYNKELFFMTGSPFGFSYKTDEDFTYLVSIILDRLSESFEKYLLEDDNIVCIQVSFTKVDSNVIS